MKGSGRYLGRTQDENVDVALTTAGKIFILAVATMLIVVATAVISLIGVYSTLRQSERNEDQAETNQLHIDCIVSLFQAEQPEVCAPVIRQLEDDGFIVRPGRDGDRDPRNDPTTSTDRGG